jgi:hypothetical protein
MFAKYKVKEILIYVKFEFFMCLIFNTLYSFEEMFISIEKYTRGNEGDEIFVMYLGIDHSFVSISKRTLAYFFYTIVGD